MKKTMKIMLTLAFVIAALCVTASAAGTNGFYDIGTADNVTFAAYAGDTAVTSKNADVDADETAEVYYENSDRIEVTYSAATTGADYGVILVEGSSLPTASSAIYYINQDEAKSNSITFNVYPATITAPSATDNNRDMTLYISSSVENAGLVSVPMNYVVGYEEVVTPPAPTFIYGDVNGDKEHTNMDKTWLAKRMVGGYDADIVGFVEEAADVLDDDELNNRDKTVLARWLVGGYYDSLPVAPENF